MEYNIGDHLLDSITGDPAKVTAIYVAVTGPERTDLHHIDELGLIYDGPVDIDCADDTAEYPAETAEMLSRAAHPAGAKAKPKPGDIRQLVLPWGVSREVRLDDDSVAIVPLPYDPSYLDNISEPIWIAVSDRGLSYKEIEKPVLVGDSNMPVGACFAIDENTAPDIITLHEQDGTVTYAVTLAEGGWKIESCPTVAFGVFAGILSLFGHASD